MIDVAPLLEGKSFCVLPWVHCHVNTVGRVLACCLSGFSYGDLKRETLSQIWRSEAICKFRAQHLSGQPVAACEQCYTKERANGLSMRLEANLTFGARI